MVFVAANAFSQHVLVKPNKMLLLQTTASKPINIKGAGKPIINSPALKPVIAPNFYVTQLGFFCKQEIKLEKTTKIPFRFRIGSIEDCDRMEGKQRRNITGQ